MNGEYAVRAENLQPLHRRANLQKQHFDKFEFEHVSRQSNYESDMLADIAIDSILGHAAFMAPSVVNYDCMHQVPASSKPSKANLPDEIDRFYTQFPGRQWSYAAEEHNNMELIDPPSLSALNGRWESLADCQTDGMICSTHTRGDDLIQVDADTLKGSSSFNGCFHGEFKLRFEVRCGDSDCRVKHTRLELLHGVQGQPVGSGIERAGFHLAHVSFVAEGMPTATGERHVPDDT